MQADPRDAVDVLRLLRTVTEEIERDLDAHPGMEDAALRATLIGHPDVVLT